MTLPDGSAPRPATAPNSALDALPPPGVLAARRAADDLRRGLPVVVTADGGAELVVAAETVADALLAALPAMLGLAALPDPEGAAALVLTRRRAGALGLVGALPVGGLPGEPALPGTAALRLPLPPGLDAAALRDLVDPVASGPRALPVPDRAGPPAAGSGPVGAAGSSRADAALALCKAARLLPAALVLPLPVGGMARPLDAASAWAARHGLVVVGADGIAGLSVAAARQLTRVAQARIPLSEAEDTRLVAFRPGDGGPEHLALLVGNPVADRPVLVRLHSECFTGDFLGSLRCDCGDQLRGAIAMLAEQGGILLYLAQEGRGIGLPSKLRAYGLQDRGLDTLEANEQLGFAADERGFAAAAEMLRQLGWSSVRLLTNNPQKVAGLAAAGIAVAERVPHAFPANDHNALYLRAKARRAGHLL